MGEFAAITECAQVEAFLSSFRFLASSSLPSTYVRYCLLPKQLQQLRSQLRIIKCGTILLTLL